jgi:SAM-dependent methyltransferase
MARGGAFYDVPHVFEQYRRLRFEEEFPILAMEEPAFLDVLGPVTGLRIADLGCGEALLGRSLLEAGCARYLGVDGSANMVEAARETLRGTAGEVVRCDIEDFAPGPGSFDVVVSRMALHYVRDVARVLAACRAAASRVVFTVVHPIITSHDARASTDEPHADWVVDDYFVPGPREQEWLGGRVAWYHRTVEDYVTALQGAGFALTDLRECAPRPERFRAGEAELARRRRIPLFLLLAGR